MEGAARRAISGPLLSKEELAAWVVGGWIASSEHRDIILGPSFSMTGLGVVTAGDYVYVTQIFQAGE